MKTLLEICQDAAAELGLPTPSVIVGASGATERRLLRHAQAAGRHLFRYHDWQALTEEHTFTSTATVAQADGLASNYDRMVHNPEVWNRTLHLRYMGPTPQRTWQRLQAGIGAGVIGYWRLLGGEFQIYPAPTAGQTIAFEHVINEWCQSSGGDGQDKWMADTDTPKFVDDLFTYEIIWRYRHARGFAQYAEDMETSEREKEKAAARDRATGRIRPANQVNWPPQPTWSGTVTT
jgi:hypothetical protein